WGGDDRGIDFPAGNNDLPFVIPVGSHLTEVVGIAWAIKLRKDPSVALTYLGDGTSSKGDFHEALTFAGQFKAPAIFIIENNHWAISVPREGQAACETLAQKAWGYGAYGLQVDGNDPLAVYKAVSEAVERARKGEGPTVLECKTYRESKKLWNEFKEAALLRDAEAMIQTEIQAYEVTPPPNPLNMFSDNYA